MIRFNCCECGRVFEVQDKHAGRVGRCASCGAQNAVPAGGADVLAHKATTIPKVVVPNRGQPQSHSRDASNATRTEAWYALCPKCEHMVDVRGLQSVECPECRYAFDVSEAFWTWKCIDGVYKGLTGSTTLPRKQMKLRVSGDGRAVADPNDHQGHNRSYAVYHRVEPCILGTAAVVYSQSETDSGEPCSHEMEDVHPGLRRCRKCRWTQSIYD